MLYLHEWMAREDHIDVPGQGQLDFDLLSYWADKGSTVTGFDLRGSVANDAS